MTSANENGLNCMGPLNLSTTDNAAAGAENVFFEMMDPNRANTSDLCEIPAQLEEILRNVYEISANDREFNPVLNSTMSSNESRAFETSSSSASNNFDMNFSNDASSLYVTPNDNSESASSVYFTPNVLAHNSNFQANPSFIYNRQENCENFAELMLDQKTYNNASATTNSQEDDNDSSPVYLNFNIQNMAQSVQTFNTEFEKYTHQAISTPTLEKKNNEINYVEYMNNIEEAWQPQLVEINAQREQIFRQIPTNIMQTTLKKIPMQKIYGFPHEIEKLNVNLAIASTKQTSDQRLLRSDAGLNVLCFICHDELSVEQSIEELYCGHKFHGQCLEILRRSSNSCLMCKQPVRLASKTPIEPVPTLQEAAPKESQEHPSPFRSDAGVMGEAEATQFIGRPSSSAPPESSAIQELLARLQSLTARVDHLERRRENAQQTRPQTPPQLDLDPNPRSLPICQPFEPTRRPLPGAYGVEIMSQLQSLNNNAIMANFSEPQQNLPTVERQIISRNPLQTRLSIKVKNSEWAIINDKTSNNNNQVSNDIDVDSELLAIDQTDPDIPFIKERASGRKRRKQSLIPLDDNDITFMNNKGEFSKFEDVKDIAVKEIKFPIDTSYITFRKKPKLNISNDTLVDSSSSAGRNNSSIKKTSQENVVNISSNSSAIIVSSDSDSEENLDSSDPKCLKCSNCKKMFKTSRSYSIHKKRCDVPGNSDNTYVIEVEYLESEKEDDVDASCDTESKDEKFMDESVEIIESDSIESLEILKQETLDEPERTDENIVRRNTRSSSLKNGTTSSISLPSLGSPNKLSLKKSTTKKSYSEGKQAMLTCEVCGKTFRQKSYLIAHKRIHEKNFKCQYCFKTFLIKTAYDTHVFEKCDKIPSVKLKRLRSTVTNTTSK